jgi:hypothetical protein
MEPNYSDYKPKKQWVLWIIVIVIMALVLLGYFYYKNKKIKLISTSSPSESPSATISVKPEEKWVKSDKVIFEATSSDTHKLSSGSYRMYLMLNGNIVYSESSDAKNFQIPVDTGITESNNRMISNPSVLEINSDNWIMVYEEQPIKVKGQTDTLPGPNSQRNLYLATSNDGKNFQKAGIIIDSSKEDNYFASVPDLVKLPDGKIRMYYVSGGDSIGSAISSDNGLTWKRESGYRLTNNAVDPDVLIKKLDDQTSWVMYYSELTGANNRIYKSTSNDGLNWSQGIIVLAPSTSGNTVIDPDVVEIDSNHFRMFYGEMAGDSTTSLSQPMLYYADFNGNIF